ncbi:plastid/chloroplast ribosomal protein L31 [Dunaliella salina]|uniref:50S ribosomal protein L31 n=1 Tax=Dunaliella salina TaxID=3046 RepID=A0ABQ7GS14_DUNSA|nr:plastid/chloroplast ribosomal protein L31 [Dunaliella salina]|eukprot:KAF5837397.1 plastid/chloroplast ribosomal protein L31 [Dunaliella salina]
MALLASKSSFVGARLLPKQRSLGCGGARGATMMKKDIHPEFYDEAPVICNGVEVMRLGGTKPQYNVDIYSGNHPFYLGNRSTMIMDEGQLNRFKKRFADMGELGEVGAAASIAGKAEDPTAKPKPAPKAPQKGGKKK